MSKKMFFNFLQCLPLTIFLTVEECTYSLSGAALCALMVIALMVGNGMLMSRFALAINISLICCGIALAGGFGSYVCQQNSNLALFSFLILIIVGFLTMWFTRAGFIGAERFSRTMTSALSMHLLYATFAAFACMVVLKEYEFWVAGVLFLSLILYSRWLIAGGYHANLSRR